MCQQILDYSFALITNKCIENLINNISFQLKLQSYKFANVISRLGHDSMQISALTASLSLGMECIMCNILINVWNIWQWELFSHFLHKISQSLSNSSVREDLWAFVFSSGWQTPSLWYWYHQTSTLTLQSYISPLWLNLSFYYLV